MPRTLFACVAIAMLLSLGWTPAIAATIPGTITGADAVNVRRGPGTDTPAFIALRRGASVQVEEEVGQWALVVLDSGERGYINAAFIELTPGATVPVPVPTDAVETPSPEETPEPTPTSIAVVPPAVDRELAALRERVSTLEASLGQQGGVEGAHASPEGGAAPPPGGVPAMVEPPAVLDVGPSLALAGVGLLVGFLFGTLYGQRQERNRRTRVRF